MKKLYLLMFISALCVSNPVSILAEETTAAESSLETISDDTSANSVTMEGQTLGLEGVGNARQLGGYTTIDGKTVKKNLLLRSAKLADATEEDIAKLKNEYNLGTIIDFRTSSEIESAPDPVIDGVENINIKILDKDDSSSSAASMTNQYSSDPVNAMIEMVNNGVLSDDMYTTILETETAQKGYGEFFQVLLNNSDGKAVLWHCTGGKDRAGTAAMLLLSALGVDKETILDDFALTNEFNAKSIEYMASEAAKKTDDTSVIEGVKTLTGVSRDYMEKTMDQLEKDYGSVTNFIIEKLGISQDDIDTLKTMYLQ